MNLALLESLPIAWFYIAVTILMLAFCEAGFRFGIYASKGGDKEATSFGPMVGGLLGMLGFVLAFTFSMANSQHDQRKQNVLEEANKISRAYLLADLLDEQHKTEIKRLLREYVDIRLQAANGGDINTAIEKSIKIHNLLWATVSAAALENPRPNTSQNIQAINDLIEMHEKRLTGAVRNRIPASVWIALAAITAFSMLAMGTQVGHTGKRRLVAVIPLVLAFAVLVTLVVDLNRPQQGLITIDQQSIMQLKSRMTNEIQ